MISVAHPTTSDSIDEDAYAVAAVPETDSWRGKLHDIEEKIRLSHHMLKSVRLAPDHAIHADQLVGQIARSVEQLGTVTVPADMSQSVGTRWIGTKVEGQLNDLNMLCEQLLLVVFGTA